jgi:methyl-accepting chemotaxis protein
MSSADSVKFGQLSNISLKTKATIIAVALSVIPVVSTGAISYFVSANNLEQTERNQKTSNTESFNANLVRFLNLRGKDILTLSNLPLSINIASSKKVAQADEEFLDKFVQNYKFYDSIAIFDLAGNPLAVSDEPSRKNHADRAYFQSVLKTKKLFFSPVEKSKTTGKLALYIAAPIFDSSGKMSGVVRARMPIGALNVIGSSFGDERTKTDWHVIDRNTNQIIGGNEEGEVGIDAMENFGSTYDKYKAADKPFIAKIYEKKTKQRRLISFQALGELEGVGQLPFTLAIASDLSVIEAKNTPLLFVLGLGMLAAGSITLGASLFLFDRVTKYIRNVAGDILNSTGQIVSTVEVQETTVNSQANSAITTTGTVNQLGSISYQAAEQAQSSASGARKALSLAEAGTQSVQQTLSGMNNLQEKVVAIANQIVDLSAQTGQIAAVSDLVAELASQTNMLALNASVEAARAGEQGKGFSVVAGEIRKLADRSKESADRINSLAEDIQKAIDRTVMVTDEGTKEVRQGIDLAENTATTFISLTDAVNNVFLNSQTISSSAKEQAIAIQQVLNAMTHISEGSQESAVGMHQVKMNTKELNEIADRLQLAVQ